MTVISPEKMTTAEKVAAMEALWVDLCTHSQVDTPEWHQKVLESRHQQRLNGQQQPMEWEQAKAAIRKQLE